MSIEYQIIYRSTIHKDYILRRIFNLIDKNALKQYLKVLVLYFSTIKSFFKALLASFNFYNTNLFSEKKFFTIA